MNWYPWDVSYMNRGRCLPYVQLNGACEPQFEGDDAWNQKAATCEGQRLSLICISANLLFELMLEVIRVRDCWELACDR